MRARATLEIYRNANRTFAERYEYRLGENFIPKQAAQDLMPGLSLGVIAQGWYPHPDATTVIICRTEDRSRFPECRWIWPGVH